MPEKLVLPLVKVPKLAERLRALRLGSQADALANALLQRINGIKETCVALRSSETLKELLRAVAHLGRWINGSEDNAECGFTLSSALGKLRQFRALRGNRDISLLHVVALTAGGGDPTVVAVLGKRLTEDLGGLSEAAREDLGQLAEAVVGFRAEAAWLEAEALTELKGHSGAAVTYFYPPDVRERMLAIHRDQICWRANTLETAWASAQVELRAVLTFFAEPLPKQLSLGTGGHCQEAAERLFRTVDDFQTEVHRVAMQVATQPQQFSDVLVSTGTTMPG